MIFIPLQMGFNIKFEGWYLFMEILTMIVYGLDFVLILKHYREIVISPSGHTNITIPLGSLIFNKK